MIVLDCFYSFIFVISVLHKVTTSFVLDYTHSGINANLSENYGLLMGFEPEFLLPDRPAHFLLVASGINLSDLTRRCFA